MAWLSRTFARRPSAEGGVQANFETTTLDHRFTEHGELLYPFVLTQFRTENRFTLSWNCSNGLSVCRLDAGPRRMAR